MIWALALVLTVRFVARVMGRSVVWQGGTMTPQEREDTALERLRAIAAEIAPGRIEHYGPGPDQLIEWYVSGSPVAQPIVLVHGGFFRPSIDRANARPLARALAAELSRPVVLMEYRRVPGSPMETVEDIHAVSDLLEGLEEQPAAWVGHSAGGTLVLQRALDPVRPAVPTLALAPVADLRSGLIDDLGNGAIRDWLGTRTARKPSRYAHLDPVVLLAALPERRESIVCVHGVDDLTVPLAQSVGSGLPVAELQGAHHFDVIDPQSPFFPDVLRLIRERLGTTAG